MRGNPDGKPAVIVHGGPGSSLVGSTGRSFDPGRYRIVLFDQRGCDRSTPHASDPSTDMCVNTTEHLLGDLELLRTQLGIERWLLGGSWGSTLILAYAERHPERVSEILIQSVTTCRRSEIDWLYGGVGRFFPEEWERFRAGAPAERDEDLLAAYARLMDGPDPDVRGKAAVDWQAWEDAVVSREPHGAPNYYSDRPPAAQLARVRTCATTRTTPGSRTARSYAMPIAWPASPACCSMAASTWAPLTTAWELARAWPDAELALVADSGHTGSETMRLEVVRALDRFARS